MKMVHSPKLIQNCKSLVGSELPSIFNYGGTTAAEQAVGTYRHDAGNLTRKVVVVKFNLKRSELASEKQEKVFELASKVAKDLSQESVAVRWGNELLGLEVIQKIK